MKIQIKKVTSEPALVRGALNIRLLLMCITNPVLSLLSQLFPGLGQG